MKRTIIIRPEAEQDIREAYSWYETQMSGLGANFLLRTMPHCLQSSGTPDNILSFIGKFGAAWCAGFLMVSFSLRKTNESSSWPYFMPNATPDHGRSDHEH